MRRCSSALDRKKFTEPVALLSTSPVNLRLPPTALGSCFGLLALRARCKRELRARPRQLQGGSKREACNLRKLLRAQHKIGVRAACSKGAGPQKFTEPVALSSTSPGNFRLPPTAPASCFGLLALRARCKTNLTRRPGPDKACRCEKRAFCAQQIVHISTGFAAAWGEVCGKSVAAGGGQATPRPAFHNMSYRAFRKNPETGGFGPSGSG
jgi:hypothetical protein